jgi:DNA topoisomerase-1
MPTSLVIVESPAKCKKIETYLGPGYKVIASYGHLRTIDGLSAIDIDNGFQPTFTVIQENIKLKQIEKIRCEIAKADEVILATDDDREGEAIAWHICDLYGLSIDNTKRIIFHEITENAIQSAVSHPKRINMNIVYAQQSRQILDLLVGYTISPILWKGVSISKKNLSAGRCQTPALRLIYDNYLKIKNSPGKLVYNTTGIFTNLNLSFELNAQFETAELVTDFLSKCKDKDFKFLCNVASPKKVFKKQPEPLTTSALQQLASNELNLSPKSTMSYAQQLYEEGYITYMRTDSKKYSRIFVDSVKTYIANVHGEQYINQNIDALVVGENNKIIDLKEKKKKSVAEKKGIPRPQEAHEAIRPVYISLQKLEKTTIELDIKAIKLYNLIWQRTLESCMPSAQYTCISAKIGAPNNSEFIYKTEQVIFPGWQIVEDKYEKESKSYNYMSALTLTQNTIPKTEIQMTPKRIETKFTLNDLTPHYTEAHLIKLLEDKGIGRPSTFASLIDKIQERKYVEKQNIIGKEITGIDFILENDGELQSISRVKEFGNEKHKLVIQPIGIIVIEFLLTHFNCFFNYEYTKEMEDKLDLISNGQIIWNELCSECNNILTTITSSLTELKNFSVKIDADHTLIIGKHGPVIKKIDPTNAKNVSFLPVKKNIDMDKLSHAHNITLEQVIDDEVTNNDAIGKYKGKDLFIKKGKYGLYAQWGKETRSLKDDSFSGPIEKIKYIDVLCFLEKDTALDPSRPVGFVRELNAYISIRTGKFGDYIFYKKPRSKTPTFLKLNDFTSDYKTCDKLLLLNWIKQVYNIE